MSPYISQRPSTQKAVHLRGGLTYYQNTSFLEKTRTHARAREGPRRCHVAALAGAAASMAPPLLRCGSRGVTMGQVGWLEASSGQYVLTCDKQQPFCACLKAPQEHASCAHQEVHQQRPRQSSRGLPGLGEQLGRSGLCAGAVCDDLHRRSVSRFEQHFDA